MEKSDHYLKIAQLIAKELNGSAEKEDLELLENWLNESDENRKIYSEIKKKSWYAGHVATMKKYRLDAGWSKIKTRMTTSSKTRMLLLIVSKYAAVVIFLFAVYFLLRDYRFEQGQKKSLVQTSIEPGGRGARLVMDDGRTITLADDRVFAIREKDGTTINKGQGIVNYIKTKEMPQNEIFNTIITNTGQEFTLILSDGTKVTLNAESKIRFPVAFVRDERIVEVSGEAYFEVFHDARHPFIVKTHQSAIRVLGTEFNIRAYEDETAEVTTLVKGSVNIHHREKEDIAVKLNPGDQATITPTNNEIKVEQVDTTYYITWKKGKFIFRNERLEDIIKNLQRWYHFEVEYKEDQLKNIRFGARIDRYTEVNPIFSIMNNTRLVHIEQNKNKIIINIPNE
jgi:ferric-dicitrate binding protein FerR (iron transport regulator)